MRTEQSTVTWRVTSGNPWANKPQESLARLVRLNDGSLIFAKPVWQQGEDDDQAGWFWWDTDPSGDISDYCDEPLIDNDGVSAVVAVSDILQLPEPPK